jgi:hypothetical protein
MKKYKNAELGHAHRTSRFVGLLLIKILSKRFESLGIASGI